MDRKDLIAEIGERFQIALTMAVFFPVLLSTYFNLVGGGTQTGYEAFIYFGFAGAYLFGYFLFQIVKRLDAPRWALEILDWELLAGIACFIVPIIFLVSVSGNKLPITWTILADAEFFKLSLWGMGIFSIGTWLFDLIALISARFQKKN